MTYLIPTLYVVVWYTFFLMIGGCLTIAVTVLAIFPLPLMVLFGIIAILFLAVGYGILLGLTPYAIAYLVKACKKGTHSKGTTILSGICQFFFLGNVVAMIALTLKENLSLHKR